MTHRQPLNAIIARPGQARASLAARLTDASVLVAMVGETDRAPPTVGTADALATKAMVAMRMLAVLSRA